WLIGVACHLRQVVANHRLVRNKRGVREAFRKIIFQCASVITAEDGANPLDAASDKNRAERAAASRVEKNVGGGGGGQVGRWLSVCHEIHGSSPSSVLMTERTQKR